MRKAHTAPLGAGKAPSLFFKQSGTLLSLKAFAVSRISCPKGANTLFPFGHILRRGNPFGHLLPISRCPFGARAIYAQRGPKGARVCAFLSSLPRRGKSVARESQRDAVCPFGAKRRGKNFICPSGPLWGTSASLSKRRSLLRSPSVLVPQRGKHVVGRNICPKGTTPSGIYCVAFAPLTSPKGGCEGPLGRAIARKVGLCSPLWGLPCLALALAPSRIGNICPKGPLRGNESFQPVGPEGN